LGPILTKGKKAAAPPSSIQHSFNGGNHSIAAQLDFGGGGAPRSLAALAQKADRQGLALFAAARSTGCFGGVGVGDGEETKMALKRDGNGGCAPDANLG
jgi:hypothetical protein